MKKLLLLILLFVTTMVTPAGFASTKNVSSSDVENEYKIICPKCKSTNLTYLGENKFKCNKCHYVWIISGSPIIVE